MGTCTGENLVPFPADSLSIDRMIISPEECQCFERIVTAVPVIPAREKVL